MSVRGDNDTTGNGSMAPWRSIDRAVASTAAGDRIKVMDDDDAATDEDTENVTVNKALTCERNDGTVPNPRIKAPTPNAHVFAVAANGVLIRGLDVHGAATGARAGMALDGASGCLIAHNHCGWDGSPTNGHGG